jgi:hypothetical protein
MAGPPSQKDIERRAYQLWQQAGMPKERDQEFYLEAERQLNEELISHELKTPVRCRKQQENSGAPFMGSRSIRYSLPRSNGRPNAR